MRGGWGDPGPHGRGLTPHEIKVNQPSRLTLVGEGYLGSATILIRPVGSPAGSSEEIKTEVEKFIFRNFRRIYLKTKPVTIDTPGEYVVRVLNHDGLDPRYELPAGQVLNVSNS
jgi:hypothetical protein